MAGGAESGWHFSVFYRFRLEPGKRLDEPGLEEKLPSRFVLECTESLILQPVFVAQALVPAINRPRRRKKRVGLMNFIL